MAKFSNAKTGERVWDIVYGWGTVDGFSRGGLQEFLQVKFDNGYTQLYLLNGKINEDDVNPMLFWNEFHIPTEEEDIKPFDLVEYLRENLEPKDFKLGESDYLFYDFRDKKWDKYTSTCMTIPTVYFSSICDDVPKTLTKEKITTKHILEAYKELGWL